MARLIEQIQGLGYRFVEGKTLMAVPRVAGVTEVRQLSVRAANGQTITIKPDGSPMMFPRVGTTVEVDVLTTCGAVYQDFYHLDEDGLSMLLHNCSWRTRTYLDAEKARIGLIGYKEGMPEGFFARDKYLISYGIGEVDVGRYADGRYVAQTAQTLGEGAYVLRLHFSRLPSKADVEDAVIIRKLERDFRLGRHKENFRCDDCGEVKHWLDIEGPIAYKLRMRLARRCGCELAEVSGAS